MRVEADMAKEHDDWLKGIGISLDKLRGKTHRARRRWTAP